MARIAAFLCLLLIAVSAFAAGTVELISGADPLPDTNGASYLSAMSADGRYVAFQSDAPNRACTWMRSRSAPTAAGSSSPAPPPIWCPA